MYGFIISLAILVSIFVAEKHFVRKKQVKTMWEGAFWGLTAGIVGARLYHVLDYVAYYNNHPEEILKFWHGGMGIYGGIAGFIIATTIYLKKKKQSVLKWLDISAQVMPLGQAIGRWGNFFNKELYGPPTNLPWGISINGQKHHPLFLYESILSMILFLGMLKIQQKYKKIKSGTFLYMYLAGYASIRILLENYRLQRWEVMGVNVTITISLVTFMLAVAFLYKQYRSQKLAVLLIKYLAVAGLAISLYMSYAKLTHNTPVCGTGNCSVVQNSEYAIFLGIPVAVMGVVYYLTVFILADKKIKKHLTFLIALGLIYSLYLTYLEIFVIHAFCRWCVGSFVVVSLMFCIQYIELKYDKIFGR